MTFAEVYRDGKLGDRKSLGQDNHDTDDKIALADGRFSNAPNRQYLPPPDLSRRYLAG